MPHRAGARSRGRVVGSRISPNSWPSRRGSTSRRSKNAAASSRPGGPSPSEIAEVRAPAGGRRRAPAHGADRCQRIPEPRGTTATARGFDVHPRALRGRFREAAGPLGCLPGKVRGAAAGAAASARPARRAQHPRDVRGEPARVGRDRGGQPRNRHSRRCRGGGFGRRFPHGRGRLRYRCPPRDRMPRASSRRPAVRGCRRYWRPAEGGGRCRRGRPPRRLPDR